MSAAWARRWWLAAAGVAILLAAHGAAAQDAAGRYAGRSYAGSVEAFVQAPGESSGRRLDTGNGSVSFVASGGARSRSRLIVIGAIPELGEIRSQFEGAEVAGEWTGRNAGMQIAITADGRIAGGGVQDGHRLRFEGRMTRQRLGLTVETERLQPGEGDRPAGTIVTLDYDLRRVGSRR